MKKNILDALENLGLLRILFRALEMVKRFDPQAMLQYPRFQSQGAPDGLPIPPRKLIVLVAGNANVTHFLDGGQLAAQSIQDTLQRNNLPIENFHTMLDFGCGCGRVIRNWRSLHGVNIYGSDYNHELIAWCDENLDFAHFDSNDLAPPLSYENNKFDLIYALSVFTHLPEELQLTWLQELTRVLQPGGYLLVTTHGDHYLDMLSAQERTRYDGGQLIVHFEQVAGTNMCSAYHPEAYVRNDFAVGFEIIDFVPRGAIGNPHQDLYLMQKPVN